jgi:DNA invertase Pin-like site-specific DNA recombinase
MSPAADRNKPLDVYVRVSRTSGRDVEAEGGTAEQQEKRCSESLSSKGLKKGEVFVDLDQSGGKISRPKFDLAIARIKSGQSGGLIFLNLSRFGRNRNVAGDILALEALGGTVISVEDNIDTSTASGALMLDVMSAFNTYYLANVTAGWKHVHKNMIGRGVPSGPTPVGYLKPVKSQPLVLDGDPEDPTTPAGVVKAGFTLRASGGTLAEVARLFTQAGLVTARGATVWSGGAAQSVIENEVYLGHVRHGADNVNRKAHDPIVTPALFRKANPAVSIASKRKGVRHSADTGGLLAKLLKCDGCGKNLTQVTQTQAGGTRRYRNYTCRNTACTSRTTIKAEAVERFVQDATLHYAELVTLVPYTTGGDTTAALDAELAAAKADYDEACEFLGVDELPATSKQALALLAAQDARDEAPSGETTFNLKRISALLGASGEDILEGRDDSSIGEKRAAITECLGEIRVVKGGGEVAERVAIVWADGSSYAKVQA